MTPEQLTEARKIAAISPPGSGVALLVAQIDAQAAEIERLKAALLWTLWRSQGGSSTIEQPLRRVLGIRKFEALTPEQIECAKRFGEQQ